MLSGRHPPKQGELDLVSLEGMNPYCAALILRCCTLDDFLEMAPEDRVAGLADLIGEERVGRVNAVLESKRAAMAMGAEMEMSSSLSTLSSEGGRVS